MRIQLISAVIILSAATVSAEPLPADPSKIEFGEVRYRLIHNDKDAGEMFYSMERRGDVIIIHEATTLIPNIRESGTAVIDATTFAPRSIVVDGDFDRTIFDADLKFADGKATGVLRIKRPDETAKTDRPLDADMPEDAILRASIFGLAAGLPLRDGVKFAFSWFNTLAGAVQDVEMEVTGRKTVTTPAGEFDTFVARLKASPENILYITVAEPRKVVRIDVVGQEMRFERLPVAAE